MQACPSYCIIPTCSISIILQTEEGRTVLRMIWLLTTSHHIVKSIARHRLATCNFCFISIELMCRLSLKNKYVAKHNTGNARVKCGSITSVPVFWRAVVKQKPRVRIFSLTHFYWKEHVYQCQCFDWMLQSSSGQYEEVQQITLAILPWWSLKPSVETLALMYFFKESWFKRTF